MGYTSTFANELLVTPFDDKSIVEEEITEKLTKREFCEHCYSKPKFERNVWRNVGEDFSDIEDDSPTKYDEINNQLYQQKVSYENFELWLGNFRIDKIYTINGNAGTGKTTFINYKKYKETNIKWIILDIHLARSFVEWMPDIRTDIENFQQAQSKVYGCIINEIWKLVFRGLDKDENYSVRIVYERLLMLVDNYEKQFARYFPSGRKLLDDICNIMHDKGSDVEKVEKASNIFKTYINGKVGSQGKGIIDTLNILLLVLRCQSYNDKKKYIVIFDNFERFIAKDELYNKDVDDIRLLLSSYIRGINQKGAVHRHCFKFIMTVRDSTARMCGVKLHASDSEASNLDVGSWYDTEDIILLKKKWYNDNKITIKNSDIIEQITGDLRTCNDKTVTGLKLIIDPLFNDNKRLIIDFIGSMVESPENSGNIRKYLALWKENTQSSKFAARSIIRGMILYELEKKPDKLFEHLKTYTSRDDTNGIGDARKILTILYNNIQSGHENEMLLSSVLSELFHTQDINRIWNEPSCSIKRKSISEILFHMNSYNRRENDWIQFVDLQFREKNSDVVVKDSDKLEKLITEKMNQCTIHLMPAGRAYLIYIVASFEFFSLRYLKNYAPLFTLIPTPEEIKRCNSVKELLCYKKIQGVTKYAGQCIVRLLNGEDSIKLFIGNFTNGMFHSMRIINHHREYIKAFNKYIKNKYCKCNDELIRTKYELLCDEIERQSNIYNNYENNMHSFSRG